MAKAKDFKVLPVSLLLGAGSLLAACAESPKAMGGRGQPAGQLADASGTAARASADQAQAPAGDGGSNDPIEGFNRGVFAVDHYLIRPVSWAYREGVPVFARDRVRDFLNNLRTPVILTNDLLQGEWDRADFTIRRFFINTTIGVVGFVDVAGSIGIPFHSEDFGQTLGTYGVGEGPYLMLPVLGPSNVRDATGLVVDTAIDPLSYLVWSDGNSYMGYSRGGATGADQRSRNIDATDDIERNSVDIYAAYRSLYHQYRESEIHNGALPSGTPYPGQQGQEDSPSPSLGAVTN
jgi:phospholipid-binding lipoprotein MlaA